MMELGAPVACRQEAFEEFARHLPRLDSTDGLWGAAFAISMHAMDDADPQDAQRYLDSLARRVLAGSPSGSFMAKWTMLHEVLFVEEGFCGETERYYSPLNSYLPFVLESRRGLPITLGLIYKAVAERVGLAVSGVNAPGHFFVALNDGDRQVIVDPFSGGQTLTEEEAIERIHTFAGVDPRWITFPEASHDDWLLRILRNLHHVFGANQHLADLEAMCELSELLTEDD